MTLTTALPPTNIRIFNHTTTSVDVDLDNIFNQLDYEYGLDGFTQGTGTLDSTNTIPFTISGLTSGTEYDLYVRNNCDSGDVSNWVGPISFHYLLWNTLFSGF